MKYLDALFVALHQQRPHDLPRAVSILALALTCNAATLIWLLRLHYQIPHRAAGQVLFLLLLAGSAAFVAFRYRPSQRASYMNQPNLPVAQPVQAVVYLLLSMLLFAGVACLLRAGTI